MIWQDGVIAVGQVLFAVALIPSVLGPQKPDRKTSLLTAIVLTVFTPTFWSLDLAWGSAMCSVAAAMWWILFAQGKRKPKIKVETTPGVEAPPYPLRRSAWVRCPLKECQAQQKCAHTTHVKCPANDPHGRYNARY